MGAEFLGRAIRLVVVLVGSEPGVERARDVPGPGVDRLDLAAIALGGAGVQDDVVAARGLVDRRDPGPTGVDGLLLVTPIVVTGFIVNWLFKFTTNSFVSLIPYSTLNKIPFLLRSLTLIVILAMLFLIGLLIRNIAGKKLFQFGDMILARIPAGIPERDALADDLDGLMADARALALGRAVEGGG